MSLGKVTASLYEVANKEYQLTKYCEWEAWLTKHLELAYRTGLEEAQPESQKRESINENFKSMATDEQYQRESLEIAEGAHAAVAAKLARSETR